MRKETEKLLLDALRQSLNPQENRGRLQPPGGEYAKRVLMETARNHAVLPLLFDAYEGEEWIDDTRFADFMQPIRQAVYSAVF